MDVANGVLIAIIVLGTVAMLFSRPLHGLIVRAQQATPNGVRISVQLENPRTGAPIPHWRTAYGFRARLAARLVRF